MAIMASEDAPTLAHLARSSCVPYEQLKKLVQRDTASTNVDDAIKIARYFGMTVNEFVGDTLAADRDRVAAIWNALSPQERELLKATAAGQIALARGATP